MEIFSGAQGQLTLQSDVGTGRHSNSLKLLWLSSLPARIKKIQLKMKALAFGSGELKIEGLFPYMAMVAILVM